MRVLVVEDDVTSRELLAATVGQIGRADVAADGQAALAAYFASLEANDPYQLLCLDIVLPGFHGDELLGMIRKLERNSGTKTPAIILMTTTYHSEQMVSDSLSCGCDGYLSKPIDPLALFAFAYEKGLLEYSKYRELTDANTCC